MFGASVAMVYGVLMVFNVVYTLFFATAITCLLRGLGWWAAHFIAQRKAKNATHTPLPYGRPSAAEAGAVS